MIYKQHPHACSCDTSRSINHQQKTVWLASLILVLAITCSGLAFAGKPNPLLDSQPHQYFSDNVVMLGDLNYSTPFGYRPLKMDLYLPHRGNVDVDGRKQDRHPVVIWIHGGGWFAGNPRASGGPYDDWQQILTDLSAKGYVVAAISYRLSSEAKFPSQIHDVKAAVRYLRANADSYGIDKDNFVVWGGSAGGHLAALLATSGGNADLEGSGGNPDESSAVQAAIDWYGPTDFLLMNSQNPEGGRDHDGEGSAESQLLGCAIQTCPEAAQSANPIAYVDATDPPFLIMHGAEDTAVPYPQSEILNQALQAAGVESSLTLVPGANHIFAGADEITADAIIDQVFEFIDTHTGGGHYRHHRHSHRGR